MCEDGKVPIRIVAMYSGSSQDWNWTLSDCDSTSPLLQSGIDYLHPRSRAPRWAAEEICVRDLPCGSFKVDGPSLAAEFKVFLNRTEVLMVPKASPGVYTFLNLPPVEKEIRPHIPMADQGGLFDLPSSNVDDSSSSSGDLNGA